MLKGYPSLEALTNQLDEFLQRTHPDFFGPEAVHPISPLKPYKVIHDPLWGTNRFSWREMMLLDSPVLQRLRGIHQTGLAHYVYPSATHSRFEHTLGVITIASRVFDSLVQRHSATLQTISAALDNGTDSTQTLLSLKAELRLAALLHDTGHSLFSHASERVYANLEMLKKASAELTNFVGKEKGAGEVLSFCLAQTKSLAALLDRAGKKLLTAEQPEDAPLNVDLQNVALFIVGRSRHPYLQFLADIISGGFDADKLDYVIRDATFAGLPLKYDLERYLYTVYLNRDIIADGKGELKKLYQAVGNSGLHHKTKPEVAFPYFDAYRLLLPKQAMSTIEQIIICKLMLFSYIYHHSKVRAAEGLLSKLLEKRVSKWRLEAKSDEQILELFLEATDASLNGDQFVRSTDSEISRYSYRIINRVLPREIYRLSPASSHAEEALIRDFFNILEDGDRRKDTLRTLETAIGEELHTRRPSLGKDADECLWNAGVWVDIPKVPKFEDTSASIGGTPLAEMFPIVEWIEAYEAHRFYIRIYSFSEFAEDTLHAARPALKKVTKIKTDDFFNSCVRLRK